MAGHNYFGDNRIYRLPRSIHRMPATSSPLDPLEVTCRLWTSSSRWRKRHDRQGSRYLYRLFIGTAFLTLHSDKEVIRIVEQVSTETVTSRR